MYRRWSSAHPERRVFGIPSKSEDPLSRVNVYLGSSALEKEVKNSTPGMGASRKYIDRFVMQMFWVR